MLSCASRRVHLADFSNDNLAAAQQTLTDDGYTIEAEQVDVSDYDSVRRFAQATATEPVLEAVVHTAGLSPSAGSAQKILEVDLLGTPNVLGASLEAAHPGAGTSVVCIASMAGHMGSGLPADLESHLATAPREKLLNHPSLQIAEDDPHGPAGAYGLSKRGNVLLSRRPRGRMAV
jgi:hypothetical protein